MGLRVLPPHDGHREIRRQRHGQSQAGRRAGQERGERRLPGQPPVRGGSAGGIHLARKGRISGRGREGVLRRRPQGHHRRLGHPVLDGPQPHLHPFQEAHRRRSGQKADQEPPEPRRHERHAQQAEGRRMHIVGRPLRRPRQTGCGERQDAHRAVRHQDGRHVPSHGQEVQTADPLLPDGHRLVRAVSTARLHRGRGRRAKKFPIRSRRIDGR
mmetsp:Transcript_14759/g.41790  ORF Transcript_14759/g.41790 Transcript_14759/m.41790 type:complete len:213 (+) Transcript_14759:708-1346(+)